MSNVQTTYSASIARGYAGQVGDANPTRKVSLIAEGGAIPYGRAVQQGTNDDQALIGSGTTAFRGIAIRVHNQENSAVGVESAEYSENDLMAVIEEGAVLVDLINTGSKDDGIYSVDADGTIGAGTAGAGQTQITGATLTETITAAGIARIQLK